MSLQSFDPVGGCLNRTAADFAGKQYFIIFVTSNRIQ